MRKLLAAVVLAFVLGACAGLLKAPETPGQQLALAELSFTEIVNQLVEARNVGLIEDNTVWRCAQNIVSMTDKALDDARRYLAQDQSIAIFIGTVQANVRALRRLHETKENICVNRGSEPTHFRRPFVGPQGDYYVQRDRDHDESRRSYGTHIGRVEPYHVGA